MNIIKRKLQQSMTENERIYGAHTYAPASAVLRNIKSQGNIAQRYSNNWIVNMEIMATTLGSKNNPFIREITVRPPGVILFTDDQIKAYSEISQRDVVYFDATGSILKRFETNKDYQIYTLLIRNPYRGGPSLPSCSNIY